MAWFPDSNWLRVLDVKGSTALAVAVSSATIIVFAEKEILYLGEIPNYLRAVIVIVGILASLIFLAKVWDYFFAQKNEEKLAKRKKIEQEEELERKKIERQDFEARVLTYLDTLSYDEKEILSYLILSNQQSFTADMASSKLATLKQKHLVAMGSGVHSQLDWPYTIPDFVWAELQRRKDDFSFADLREPHPWRDPYF